MNAVELNWVTSAEENLKHFDVQHSQDGANWQSLTNESAKGTSSTGAAYIALHNNPKPNADRKIYYRLALVEENGETNYSQIREVEIPEIKNRLVLYPNPIKSGGLVYSNLPIKNAQLFDLKGNSITIDLNANSLKLPTLAAGTYVLRINDIVKRIVVIP